MVELNPDLGIKTLLWTPTVILGQYFIFIFINLRQITAS